MPGGVAPAYQNSIDNYAQITVEQVRAHLTVYIAGNNQAAQDSQMLYQATLKSFDENTITKLRNKQNKHHIGICACDKLLLCIVIREAHLDTNASLCCITNAIQQLPEHGNS